MGNGSKEKLTESVRAKVTLVVSAIIVLVTALAGLFPGIKMVEIN